MPVSLKERKYLVLNNGILLAASQVAEEAGLPLAVTPTEREVIDRRYSPNFFGENWPKWGTYPVVRRRPHPMGWRCDVFITDELTITLHVSRTLYDRLTEAEYMGGVIGFVNYYSRGLTPDAILSDAKFRPSPAAADAPAEEWGIQAVTALRCTECEQLTLEPGGPIYECRCGETFTREESADGESHRCPQCGLFSSLLDEESCPECGSQVEETPAFQCRHCEELYLAESEALACCPPPEESIA